jgi:transcriptional regulator with XRE-family HTH domain
MIDATQCKMARAALGLGVRELAAVAKVSPDTVARFERGEELRERTVDALRGALEAAGAEFISENGGGRGVRLRRVRKFEEVSAAGLSTGRVAFVADIARFDAVYDRDHWREVAFNSEQERKDASGFKAVFSRAIAEGFAIAK